MTWLNKQTKVGQYPITSALFCQKPCFLKPVFIENECVCPFFTFLSTSFGNWACGGFEWGTDKRFAFLSSIPHGPRLGQRAIRCLGGWRWFHWFLTAQTRAFRMKSPYRQALHHMGQHRRTRAYIWRPKFLYFLNRFFKKYYFEKHRLFILNIPFQQLVNSAQTLSRILFSWSFG